MQNKLYSKVIYSIIQTKTNTIVDLKKIKSSYKVFNILMRVKGQSMGMSMIDAS